MEHLIFISHSSKDAPLAQLICHRLEEALRLFEELEAEMEQAFGAQSPDLLALREKLSLLK